MRIVNFEIPVNHGTRSVDKSDAMESKRSTRRSVNPPDSEEASGQDDSSNSLSDVESILNEIECLVAGGGNEGTAKPTSVVESSEPHELSSEDAEITLESDVAEQDIKQLKVDLDAAIASELSQLDVRTQAGVTPDQVSSDSETEVRDSNENEEVKENQCSEPVSEPEVTNQIASHHGLGYRFVELLSSPLTGLSKGSRMVVSLFAISMALWVPLIWMLALMSAPAGVDSAVVNTVDVAVNSETDGARPGNGAPAGEVRSDLDVH